MGVLQGSLKSNNPNKTECRRKLKALCVHTHICLCMHMHRCVHLRAVKYSTLSQIRDDIYWGHKQSQGNTTLKPWLARGKRWPPICTQGGMMWCFELFFFNIFVFNFYLKISCTQRVLHLLVHPSNCQKKQSCDVLRLGVRSSLQVFHVGAGPRVMGHPLFPSQSMSRELGQVVEWSGHNQVSMWDTVSPTKE